MRISRSSACSGWDGRGVSAFLQLFLQLFFQLLFQLFLPLCLLLTSLLAPAALAAHQPEELGAADLLGKLDIIVEDQMKQRSVPGLQACLFDSERIKGYAYGHIDPHKQKRMKMTTLLQAGSLVRPLTAYLLLRRFTPLLERPIWNFLPGLTFRSSAASQNGNGRQDRQGIDLKKLTLHHLLSMTSGLPASRAGIALSGDLPGAEQQSQRSQQSHEEDNQRSYRRRYLADRLQLTERPGSRIALAPEGYGWAGLFLEQQSGLSFKEILRGDGKRIALASACIEKRDCPAGSEFGEGLTLRGQYLFAEKAWRPLYPTADSLYVSACGYAQFLRLLWQRAKRQPDGPEAQMLQRRFSYDERLGGSGYGLFQARPIWKSGRAEAPIERELYHIESLLPGYAASAFVDYEGKGAVLLINSANPAFIYELRSQIWELWNILNRKPEKVFEKIPPEELAELSGFYRPLETLPTEIAFLSFINDLHLRENEGEAELGSIFDKHPPLRLFRIEKDLYLARGSSGMDSWRIIAARDKEKKIEALVSDLARFERVPTPFSVWGIILILGVLAMLPMLATIGYFIAKGPQSKRTDDA